MTGNVSPKKDVIGSGRNITQKSERSFKRGSLMFIEGELSTEMFIIRSGKVRILKQEGENSIELATLGPGSVLGELSLLDHQPRGATAQVVEDLTATVVDEKLLEITLKVIPNWLANIIQLVVKRLRDTMKRTSDDVVQKSIGSVIRILLLLDAKEGYERDGERRVLLSNLKDSINSAVGIGGIEAENVLLHLILKDMIYIRKDDSGKEYVVLKALDVLELYMNYLRAKQRGNKLLGEDFSEEAINLINNILGAVEKHGKRVNDKIVSIGLAQVELEQNRDGQNRSIDLDALDVLTGSKVVLEEAEATKSNYGTHKRKIIMFNTETLGKIILLNKWISTFREDVQF